MRPDGDEAVRVPGGRPAVGGGPDRVCRHADHRGPPQTIIDGEVLDESHLHGIIVQLQVLGITVVFVHPVP
jgi:hypothetical protein